MAHWTFAALLFTSLSIGALEAKKDQTNEQGIKWLKANKEKPGVITLKSGLQYKILATGKGKYHAKPEAECHIQFIGTTVEMQPDAPDLDRDDWDDFDNSYQHGDAVLWTPKTAIKGWQQAFSMMVEGDHWELYMGADLGYGDEGSGEKVQAGEALIFRLQLDKIEEGQWTKAHRCNFKTRVECEDDENAFLDIWVKKSDGEVQAEVKRLKAKLDAGTKAGEREKMEPIIWNLKNIVKLRKKGEEL